MKPEKYRRYTIDKTLKPIPDRSFDINFVHDEYDGAPDAEDNRAGNAGTVEEARDEIDEIIAGEAHVCISSARNAIQQGESSIALLYLESWLEDRKHD